MITNFQLKPRQCKYHNLPQQFICLNKQCQYRALLCSACTRQNHSTHFHDIRSIQSFIQSFKQKVKYYQNQFDKDKVIINVKQITKSKLNQLDQTINQIIIHVVKTLEQEKIAIKARLLEIEARYQLLENQYKKNLQVRYDVLDYLSKYKNSPKTLQARILCSSEWGVVSIKNTLNDIKNLSANQGRNVNLLTQTIVAETEKVLKESNFLFGLKAFVMDSELLPQNNNDPSRKQRIKSTIQKSFESTNVNNTLITTPKSSRVMIERQRTFSLSNMNQVPRPVSTQNIERVPSLQRIPGKNSSQGNLENNRYLRGLRRLKLQNVINK